MREFSTESGTTRRRWLLQALAFAGVSNLAWAVAADEDIIPFADDADFLAEGQPANPRVKNFDLRQLVDPLTSSADFFVFHQTTTPLVDLATWRLHVGGLVEKPQRFSMGELQALGLPAAEIEMTIECGGNSPREDTLNGQVGNARWSGVSLRALLTRCGISPDAREVVFFGVDQTRTPSGDTSGPHARSVFVQDALHPDALLATAMNGKPLSPDHGFPLRLILPGWYGMAQIKWLTRIEVLDRRYEGLHMSRNYHTLHAVPGDDAAPLYLATSISRTRLKSVVAQVTRRRADPPGSLQIAGAAWGGATPIARVEVCIDRGEWRPASIDRRGGPYGWLLWSYAWHGPTPGPHLVSSRAIDTAGRIQPTLEEWSREIRSARENNAQWERRLVIPA